MLHLNQWYVEPRSVRELNLLAGCAFALSLIVPGIVQATEGGASLYVPGLRGPMAGIVPPPGFYFENDFYSYSGRLTASNHPYAEAVAVGGWVTLFLGFALWPVVLIWAYVDVPAKAVTARVAEGQRP